MGAGCVGVAVCAGAGAASFLAVFSGAGCDVADGPAASPPFDTVEAGTGLCPGDHTNQPPTRRLLLAEAPPSGADAPDAAPSARVRFSPAGALAAVARLAVPVPPAPA